MKTLQNTILPQLKNDPKLTFIPSEKAPIGILARLQLSRNL